MEQDIKALLARELIGIMNGWSQVGAAGMLGLRQQDVSRIWRGELAGFSVARLLRLIAERGYNIEVQLTVMPRPFARPRQLPSVRVVRFDRYGRVAPSYTSSSARP